VEFAGAKIHTLTALVIAPPMVQDPSNGGRRSHGLGRGQHRALHKRPFCAWNDTGCARYAQVLSLYNQLQLKKSPGVPLKGWHGHAAFAFRSLSQWERVGVREVEALNLLGSAFTLPLSRQERKSPSRLRYMSHSVRIWRFQKSRASTWSRMQ
jgi:hypothetical protein